ncbi:MAG: hypothetical protein COS85_21025 [Armatimonadetes bacterium CG07_land_8_20_14_0_80_59_28]|nr:MAG: hypothetical protein COS85_21025 [Armatimonadetes bacterium CG07_land_8_20_14_0_80_59_28]PIX39008.1 MAG: hypothetical protein COZ56_18865 [Armatimonadetes bacterium CG_4_8_14_3_um_filter_58_9]
MKGVLRRYPIKSVMNDKAFFSGKEHVIGGKAYFLNDIEKGILREKFKDQRIHFALVCASGGCPPLQSKAFTASGLDSRLDAAAKAFIADSQSPK